MKNRFLTVAAVEDFAIRMLKSAGDQSRSTSHPEFGLLYS